MKQLLDARLKMTDSVLSLIKNERDIKDIILWADNCTGQNKNWTLYTALIHYLNSEFAISQNIETITMKYLTKCHTHMSADGVHGNIERKIKQIRNISEFKDLKNCITSSRKNINIIELKNFYEWLNKKRSTNIKKDPLYGFKMNNIVMAKIFKGSTVMEYWTDFKGESKTLDFLQKKFIKNIKTYTPNKIMQQRAISVTKKNEIVQKLVSLMPESRKQFWTSLPVSTTSEDLVLEIGIGDSFINECE